MERGLLTSTLDILKNYVNEYIASQAADGHTMRDIKLFNIGQNAEFDDFPAINLISIGWNKQSDDLTFTKSQNIICVYRYQIEIYLEGDDGEELELLMPLYKKAIMLCLYDKETEMICSYGCMVSSGENYNIAADEDTGNLMYGARLSLEIYAPMFSPNELTP